MPRPSTSSAEWHALSGWGESQHRVARVRRPHTVDELETCVAEARGSGRRLTLRGAGRSYGDAALPVDRDVLDLGALRAVGEIDAEDGRVVLQPGATVQTLWQATLPHGWWPPVVPGTMRPTIGGCVAMNVHGKNHHQSGPIGEHIEELDLLLASGERRVVHCERDAELFRAVVGGAGLLGVVVSVTLRLRRITSGYVDVGAAAAPSLASIAEALDARRDDSDYLVGWIDAFDTNGRGVVHAARHVDDPAAGGLEIAAQELPPRLLGIVPRTRVAPLLGLVAHAPGIRLVNALKYRSAALRGAHEFRQAHAAFHFLLDYVPGWKSMYAPGGMIQHQSFVPAASAVDVHSRVLALCRAAGIVPWLAVYKRHRSDAFLLSHSLDGFSLALDFPVTESNRSRLWELCRALDAEVLAAGGRFYFAKDSTAEPESARSAYPGLERFRAWKRELDPHGMFVSALSERLGLLDV